ncbi:hypothetical protein [[Haemophilus] ducreyi]|uniref:hypothetical protein n=1 Tax=Haemophilus ducreyi TaxID=730 RepID=UPI00065553D8|nr:hypothetical protein [[Haemophilus] ducreyi]AKO45634.1 hypothetical protein RZ66_05230 [[Haemophilus] ducreyi]AKO47020.1 hypothetical protein RZ67_05145 [[Haemophilus] ducreyi]AKO48365.1 hypothetical protein RZ68_05130 [[Haemophilus] ducreyi]AKO49752.1 hypothetical protein RZ69_05170 [[Haemophilus] ducreyi]ANF61360.1 hypothetical protein A6037_00510 [[Haemophilus] ducreyi]
MSAEFIIQAELYSTLNNCQHVELKLPQAELAKLQLVATSKSETINYSDYTEFFLVSFSITLSFWLLAKAIGIMLTIIKKA